MISKLNLRASILLGLGLAAWPAFEHSLAGSGFEAECASVHASAAGWLVPPPSIGSPPSETDGETLAGATGGHSHPHGASPRRPPGESRVRPADPEGVPSAQRGRLPGWATTLPPPALS